MADVPYEAVADGAGWLRRPIQPGRATSSAPRRAVASPDHSRRAVRWATGWWSAGSAVSRAIENTSISPGRTSVAQRASCATAWAAARSDGEVASARCMTRTGREVRTACRATACSHPAWDSTWSAVAA